MEEWKWAMLLVFSFGFFKELRPSEPYLTEYLVGPQINLTQSEVYQKVYPVWTYSDMCLLPVVFLLTDITRYKPVIIIEGIAYIGTWALLIWSRGILMMQLMQFVYAIATSTEVAYYTYIYAIVEKDKYKIVTSLTRTAFLIGQFSSGILSQILVSTNTLDYLSLNYVSFASVSIAFLVALFLPNVKYSMYFYPKMDRTPIIADQDKKIVTLDALGSSGRKKPTFRQAIRTLYRDFLFAYSQTYVVKLSIWWAMATAGFFQVGNYIQPLWKAIYGDNNEQIVYNGVVEGISTLLGAAAAMSVNYIAAKWELLAELCLFISSLFQALMLYMMAKASSIWMCYAGYICFRISYQFMITVASYQVSSCIQTDSYGLVFGINTFVALIIGSLLTFAVADESGFALKVTDQFVVYSSYFLVLSVIFLGFLFAILRKRTLAENNARGSDEVTQGVPTESA